LVALAETLLFYLVVGAFAGTLAGLLGIGGGLLIVPALVWSFHLQGMTETVIMHMAVGTSLATIVITSLSSVYAHYRLGAVLWRVFWRLAPGIVSGALLGAVIADALPSATLQTFFGVFVLLAAANMGFGGKPAPHRELPNTLGMVLAGVVIGVISAIVGIGGGTLTVPLLTWCNTSIRHAVATSAACGMPIAIAGATGFMVTGWQNPQLPAWSSGYIYVPAFLGIVAASVLFAPLGAKLAHTLPTGMLKRIFAVFLAIVGMRMLAG
jgi:hypothetical protein